MSVVLLYDTTLRDGTQGANVSFTSEEKLLIAQRLDEFGIHYVEGGWPGSNPRDMRFFELAKRAPFTHARLTAFSATRRPNVPVEKDQSLKAVLESEAPVIAIFGKSWDLHVEKALCTTLEENLAMIRESVAFMKENDRELVYDAEQFFDGYKANPDYAVRTLLAACEGGADFLTLCDTNGGCLPHEIREITTTVRRAVEARFPNGVNGSQLRWGIHTHNDCGMAVANSIAAVRAGAIMVQGTINGYGERTGNADLTAIIPILCLKMGVQCVPPDKLRALTDLARFVSETANMIPFNARPFVGKNAFAHKAGVHVNAVMKFPESYEHVNPELVGNSRRILVSDLSGKSNVEYKAKEFGVELGPSGLDSRRIVDEVKRLEQDGYQFDMAEGSFRLLMDRLTQQFRPLFDLESFRITIEKYQEQRCSAHAIVKIRVGHSTEVTASEGHDPVKVLEKALRQALADHYPDLSSLQMIDLNARILPGRDADSPRARIIIESTDGRHRWSTMGVSENIIEAIWQALVDSVQYKLSKARPQEAGNAVAQVIGD